MMKILSNPHRLHALYRLLRRRVWRRWDEFIFVVDLAREPRSAPPLPTQSFSTLSLDMMTSDKDFPELELVDRHDIMRRLRRGDVCFLAHIDGRVAAYAWTGQGVWSLDDIAIDVPMDNDEVYLYDVYASPQHRGQGLFYPFMRYVWEQSVAAGIRTAYTRVRRRNIAALAGIRFFRSNERVELISMRVMSAFRFYHATVGTTAGRGLQKFLDARTQLGVGVLMWTAGEQRGFRVSLAPFRGTGSGTHDTATS